MWFVNFILSFGLLHTASSTLKVRVEPQIGFPVVGTRFQVQCYADGSDDKKIPRATFKDINSKVYTNTSNRKIIVQQNQDTFQENLTMIWDPITLQDMATMEEQTSACGDNSFGRQFIVLVIPKPSEPRMSVNPRRPVSGKAGEDMQFECYASIDVLDPLRNLKKVRNISIEWLFENKPLSSNQTKIENEQEVIGRSTLKQSRLTIMGLNQNNVGTYSCIANLVVVDARNNTYRSKNTFQKTIVLSKVTSTSSSTIIYPNMSFLVVIMVMALKTAGY